MSQMTEDEKDNAFEFNDLETDERINIDVCQFEMAFPDPLYHCIGFFADIENEQRNYQRNT